MLLREKISALRKSKGISQELLAENSRVSLRTIQRIETGDSTPRPFTLKAIADALEVPVESLHVPGATEEINSEEVSKLQLINLCALCFLIVPLTNILLPLIVWRKNRDLPHVNEGARRIISFQIFWSIGTIILLICTGVFVVGLTRTSRIGHLPPTLFLVYFVMAAVNLCFILHAAIQLRKDRPVFSFVPIIL
jgi:XRE family transcriptional regulator, regulator of sulfur utilization